MLMNNESQENINMDLSRDNIYSYIFTTQGYSEEQDDKRKRPLFYWKAFHMYPVVIQNPEQYDFDDEDFDPSDLELIVFAEGGDSEHYDCITMNAADLRDFMRNNPSFRTFTAEDLFDELNVI